LNKFPHKLNEIFVFNAGEVCSKRFNLPDRSIDYLHTGEIPPEKLKAILAKMEEEGTVSSQARQQLEHEWLALAEHHEVLRVWDGEKIVNVHAHYFDSNLLETVEKLHQYKANHDFIKAARVIGEALAYCGQYIGDTYFEYRLRYLIYYMP
jgi:hypothetical protein